MLWVPILFAKRSLFLLQANIFLFFLIFCWVRGLHTPWKSQKPEPSRKWFICDWKCWHLRLFLHFLVCNSDFCGITFTTHKLKFSCKFVRILKNTCERLLLLHKKMTFFIEHLFSKCEQNLQKTTDLFIFTEKFSREHFIVYALFCFCSISLLDIIP